MAITSKQLCVRAAFLNRTLHLTTKFDMETKLDNATEPQHDAKLPVVGQSELLVNFLWEQYKIHRIITKKAYMTMVANARKINQ
jgi:hypothetical protein